MDLWKRRLAIGDTSHESDVVVLYFPQRIWLKLRRQRDEAESDDGFAISEF